MDRVSVFPHGEGSVDRQFPVAQTGDLGPANEVDDIVRSKGRRACPQVRAQGGRVSCGER